MRPLGSPELLESRRLRAVALLKDGLMPVEAAKRLGVDRRSVRRWKQALREGGSAALSSKPVPGRPPKLKAPQLRGLERVLFAGARKQGFATDVWTCPRVAEVIRRQWGVSYHVDHVSRVLHALGWSPQRPQRRAAERDEEAIAGWIQHQWPTIKKSPAAGRVDSVHRRKRFSDGPAGAPLLESLRPDAGVTPAHSLAPENLGHRRPVHRAPTRPGSARFSTAPRPEH